MPGPTPEQLARGGSESGEQVALFCWAALHVELYPELRLLFAIPNGGLRNKITAARMKAEGVKSGVPDTFLPVNRGKWHGLFIELKRHGKHHISAEQAQWMIDLRAQGFAACVCVGWEAARDMLVSYLNWRDELEFDNA